MFVQLKVACNDIRRSLVCIYLISTIKLLEREPDCMGLEVLEIISSCTLITDHARNVQYRPQVPQPAWSFPGKEVEEIPLHRLWKAFHFRSPCHIPHADPRAWSTPRSVHMSALSMRICPHAAFVFAISLSDMVSRPLRA